MNTLHGIPIVHALVSANTDEQAAAETIIDHFSGCDFFANNALLGLKLQTEIFDQTNNLVWKPCRSNQNYRTQKYWPVGSVVFEDGSKASSRKYITRGKTLKGIDKNYSWFMHSCHHENDQPLVAPSVIG